MAHYSLGLLFQKKSMFEDSLRSYKKAIEINPNYEMSHYQLGLLYFKNQMNEEALKCFNKAN